MKILFYNLLQMINNHDQYYDSGVADYILGRLSVQEINEHTFQKTLLKNYNVESNLIGMLLLSIKDMWNKEENKEKILSNDMSYQLEKKEQWFNLLENKNIHPEEYLTKKIYKLKKVNGINKGKEEYVDFYTLLGMLNIEKFYINNDINQITKEGQKVIIEDLLEEEQSYSLFSLFLERNQEFIELISQWLVENINKIKEEWKKTDADLTNKILNSKNLKQIIHYTKSETISSIFSLESLRAIHKKANEKDNIRQFPNMVSDLLYIAPPEKWIEAHFQKRERDIVAYFNPIVKYITNEASNEIINKYQNKVYTTYENKGSKTKIDEIIKRLSYLGKEFNNLSEEQRINWFYIVFRLGDENVYLKTRQFIELPNLKEKIDFYEIMLSDTNKSSNKTWLDVEKQYLKDKLNEDLTVNDNKIKKLKV